MTNELQIRANRGNAELSTGPVTENGKTVVSKNATRHGILTGQLLLEHEDPDELDLLRSDVRSALAPVGAIEEILADRIIAAIWRQRRLLSAESATIQLGRRPKLIAEALSNLDNPYAFGAADTSLLEPFDEDQAKWCAIVITEFENLEEIDLETVEREAPHIYAQLLSDAEEDNQTPTEYIDDLDGDLSSYVIDLLKWCRSQLRAAEQRPRLLALADQLQRSKLVLPVRQLDLLARYQTTLDNQLYKALRALREAQLWRQSQERMTPDAGEQ